MGHGVKMVNMITCQIEEEAVLINPWQLIENPSHEETI